MTFVSTALLPTFLNETQQPRSVWMHSRTAKSVRMLSYLREKQPMLSKSKLLLAAGASVAAAASFAAPASAQYNPYGYNRGGDVVGAIIRGVLGAGAYGQYPYGNYGYGQGYYGNEQAAINQCSRVVEQEINRRYATRYDRRYDDRYDRRYDSRYDRRYDDRYEQRYDDRRYGDRVPDQYRTDPYVRQYGAYGGQARIAGITDVDRKGYGLKIKGVALSGRYATEYNRYDRRGYGYGQRPDIKWDCEIDRSGRIRDIDIKRR